MAGDPAVVEVAPVLGLHQMACTSVLDAYRHLEQMLGDSVPTM